MCSFRPPTTHRGNFLSFPEVSSSGFSIGVAEVDGKVVTGDGSLKQQLHMVGRSDMAKRPVLLAKGYRYQL